MNHHPFLKANMTTDEAIKSLADKYTTPLPTVEMVRANTALVPTATPSKLDELVSALTDIPKQVDDAATQALTRLTAARDRANAGIGKVNDIAVKIEQTAQDIEAFTSKLTNHPPA
jgi:hypothetical protein